MARRIILVFALLFLDVGLFAVPAAAAGTVSVQAWKCPESVDKSANSAQEFAAACTEEAAGTRFALTAGVTRNRDTAAGKPASWLAISGPFTVAIAGDAIVESVVFCRRDGGPFERVPVEANAIQVELTTETGIECLWYLVPAAPAPTSTRSPSPSPQPTNTVQPTATSLVPTATVLPTATPFATPTAQATATPAALGPLPETAYPPAMFRSDERRTGEQRGPAPEGDPVVLWRYPVGDRPISSPVLSGGTIYVGGNNGIYAIHALTGTLKWRYAMDRNVVSTPAVVGGLLYAGGQDGRLVCLVAETGAERWTFQSGGMILSSPLVHDGSVYFTSYDGHLYALDDGSGELRWKFLIDGSEFVASPAFWDGQVIVATGDIDGGYLYGVGEDDGDELWRHQVAGSIGGTPAVVDGIAYFGSDDGYAYAYNVVTEERVYRKNTGKLIRSSAAVFDGTAYYGNRLGLLVAFDAESGDRRWEFETGDWVDSSPSFLDGVIYVGTKHRKLYVLNASDASVIWEFNIGASITTAPVVEGGVVYIAARDGFVYAVGGTESSTDIRQAGIDRPADWPLEITLEGERFLFDRLLEPEVDELSLVAAVGNMTVYTDDDSAVAGPIYVHIDDRNDEEEDKAILARYLPEFIGVASAECPAEAPRLAAVMTDGQSTFAFAGFEPDLSIDELTVVVPESPVGTIYSPGELSQSEELIAVGDDDVLNRFALLDSDGVPRRLRGLVPFAGQIFSFAGDATNEAAGRSLIKLGCAGPFPAFAEEGGTKGALTRIYALVNGRYLAFDAIEPELPPGAASPPRLAAMGPFGVPQTVAVAPPDTGPT